MSADWCQNCGTLVPFVLFLFVAVTAHGVMALPVLLIFLRYSICITMKYCIVYFQHITKLTSQQDGMIGKEWTEEQSYRGPPQHWLISLANLK